MHVMELPCIAARVAYRADGGAIASKQNPDDVVLPIGDQQVFLGGIVREGDIVVGTHANGIWVHEEFLHELAVLGKNLDSVVGSIAHVNEAVMRNMDAMNGIPE
jgi:hypothetical protein